MPLHIPNQTRCSPLYSYLKPKVRIRFCNMQYSSNFTQFFLSSLHKLDEHPPFPQSLLALLHDPLVNYLSLIQSPQARPRMGKLLTPIKSMILLGISLGIPSPLLGVYSVHTCYKVLVTDGDQHTLPDTYIARSRPF